MLLGGTAHAPQKSIQNHRHLNATCPSALHLNAVSIAGIGVGDNIAAMGDLRHGGMTPVQSDLRHGGVTGTMVASILATPSLTSVTSVMRAQIVSLKDMREPKPHCW